jgi:alkylated DNA repair dioxygenase AlkB
MATIINYEGDNLDFDLCQNFLSQDEADAVFETCDNLRWTEKQMGRRANISYGDKGFVYVVAFKRTSYSRKVIPWEELPILETLKTRIEELTGNVYNCCAVMRYPSGDFGIAPHRDKEMIAGTTICGLSVGQKRTFVLSPPYYLNSEDVKVNLNHGSLYSIKPPTNSYWSHHIPKEPEKTGIRYSLTFRNAPENMEEIVQIPKPTGFCSAILKSGKRKGESCGSKIFRKGQKLCGRHNR